MTRIIMHGCNGHMGQVITGIVANDANAQIVAGIDLRDDGHNSYPVFASLEECDVEADVIIDFASAKAEDTLVDYIKKTKIPAVICTTGLSDEQISSINAPSGTALALADSMKEVLDDDYFYRYDRSQLRQKRDPKEIGISAVRGGTIVGEHEVIFAGEDEVIEFKHTAHSKAVFAKGAVEAAKFLAGKPAGMYDMRDVIAAKN